MVDATEGGIVRPFAKQANDLMTTRSYNLVKPPAKPCGFACTPWLSMSAPAAARSPCKEGRAGATGAPSAAPVRWYKLDSLGVEAPVGRVGSASAPADGTLIAFGGRGGCVSSRGVAAPAPAPAGERRGLAHEGAGIAAGRPDALPVPVARRPQRNACHGPVVSIRPGDESLGPGSQSGYSPLPPLVPLDDRLWGRAVGLWGHGYP